MYKWRIAWKRLETGTVLCRIARNLFFYWVLKRCTRNSAKIRPLNRPIVQSDKTRTQSRAISKTARAQQTWNWLLPERQSMQMYSNCSQRMRNCRKTCQMYRAREEAHFRVSVGKPTLLDNYILKSDVKMKAFLC